VQGGHGYRQMARQLMTLRGNDKCNENANTGRHLIRSIPALFLD
jgi:hypothetical protein